MCREFLSRSARFEIAVAVGKSNYAISVGYVQELWIVARWIKGDPERFVQTAFCKNFSDVGLASALRIAQHLDLIYATLHNEDVAIWCGEEEPRITKSSGVQFDFEPWRNFGFRVSWTVYNARPINCKSIRTRWRQILRRDFARDAGRIARPIRHRRFDGENGVFGGRGSYRVDD